MGPAMVMPSQMALHLVRQLHSAALLSQTMLRLALHLTLRLARYLKNHPAQPLFRLGLDGELHL
jgi:hypothetical protein